MSTYSIDVRMSLHPQFTTLELTGQHRDYISSTLHCLNIVDIGNYIKSLCSIYIVTNVRVENTGLGAALVDYLRDECLVDFDIEVHEMELRRR